MAGYIYCLSNESMEGLLKIGRTMRTPEERVKELYSTGVPTPFKIEFAKKVADVVQKERLLHILLGKYTLRLPGREFFKTDTATVKEFFALMDGEDWVSEEDKFLTDLWRSPEKPKKSPSKGQKKVSEDILPTAMEMSPEKPKKSPSKSQKKVSEDTLPTAMEISPEKPKKSPSKGRKKIVMEPEIVCQGKAVSIPVEPTTPEKIKKVITAVYKKKVEDV
jgi:hypothetical protein